MNNQKKIRPLKIIGPFRNVAKRFSMVLQYREFLSKKVFFVMLSHSQSRLYSPRVQASPIILWGFWECEGEDEAGN